MSHLKDKKEKYLVTYTEGVNPNSELKVVVCCGKEEAYEESLYYMNKAWNVSVFKQVKLGVFSI